MAENTVTLNIDGKDVTVEKGITVLQAAQKLNIHIPTLCYLKDVQAIGACCVCCVEVEGAAHSCGLLCIAGGRGSRRADQLPARPRNTQDGRRTPALGPRDDLPHLRPEPQLRASGPGKPARHPRHPVPGGRVAAIVDESSPSLRRDSQNVSSAAVASPFARKFRKSAFCFRASADSQRPSARRSTLPWPR